MIDLSARKIAVALAVILSILAPGLVLGLHLGLDQAQFAAQGDTTLRAAPYAFSIWGLIYLGLIAYAAFHARRDSAAAARFGWPSVVSIGCCGLWIVTTALNLQIVSLGVILLGAAAAAWPLTAPLPSSDRWDLWLVVWPNALLCGWLVTASALAVVTVATAQHWIPSGAQPIWAFAGLAAVVLVAATIALRARVSVVLLPVVWGLAAIAVAEAAANPPAALAAGAAAAGLALLGLGLVIQRRTSAKILSARRA